MRLLFFFHRWIGVMLAVFMLLWFSSGLIIANSGTITLTRAAQLAHLPSLHPLPDWLSAGAALEKSSEKLRKGFVRDGAIVDARLHLLGDEPAWIVENSFGERAAVSAVSGGPVDITITRASRVGANWLASEGKDARLVYLDTVETVEGLRNAEALRPFHRFYVEDDAGTLLVISAKSGEVLQAASRIERGLYYAGAWLHLFRPLDMLGAGDYRRAALTYAGFLAFVGAATGIAIGWSKWRPGFFGRATYSQGRTQPYRETWLKYHFWAGLIAGVFAMLWAGSGFLSTNPGRLFFPAAVNPEELARYHGAASPISGALPAEAAPDPGAVELRWSRLGDQSILLAYGRDGARRPLAGAKQGFADAEIEAAVLRLGGEARIASRERLLDYDSYYFAGHGQGVIDRPLPALRVDLADQGHTSVYVDPADGRLLLKVDDGRRAYRWLYSAAHHWDFGWFRAHHGARRLWISIWALFGLALAASAATLAWRRVKRSLATRPVETRTARTAPVARGS